MEYFFLKLKEYSSVIFAVFFYETLMAEKNIVSMFDANDHKGCLYLIVIEYYVLSPSLQQSGIDAKPVRKKVSHTRLPSVGFLAVRLQVT